ncbi:hypothetical protein TSYNTROPHJE_16820 [Tepidanaerobacter syntrophicus]|uniref:O-antigen polymerase n=1 Tax=Tepidanaerobacter syntrophicus TaxID=224999 RepID=UPI0022EE6B6B|nr:O-antigen polymerase [Tepidanaerobacter syntrophicus]GLI19869.1 hypothetical protein TSYNTROPHJE_16820 [Tepidanaerobacter syntrophicus]
MIYAYIFINILYTMFSMKFYKAKINPISLYSIVWTAIVVLYELKLIYYYELTATTWMVLIFFQLAYNLGCIFGKKRYCSKNNISSEQIISSVNTKNERDLRITILILSVLTSISVISNLSIAIKTYGFKLLASTNQLYSARLAGDIEAGIPYLGALVYPALIYSGVYFTNFGFNKIILLPILLSVLGELKSGGRFGFVFGAFLLLIPLIFKRGRMKNKIIMKPKAKNKISQNVKIILSASIIIIVFFIVTKNRSTWITYNPYMSPLMIKLVEVSPSIYKNYSYFASPLGVLNEFLKNPTFNFGGHTFLTIYNFLNKLGADIPVNQYQTFYYVPVSCNVGTYIRELVEDFTIPLAFVVTFATGFIFSYNYSLFRKKESYVNLIWASTFAFVIFFSFYMWQLRSSSMWITLVAGTISGYILDRNSRMRLKKLKSNLW